MKRIIAVVVFFGATCLACADDAPMAFDLAGILNEGSSKEDGQIGQSFLQFSLRLEDLMGSRPVNTDMMAIGYKVRSGSVVNAVIFNNITNKYFKLPDEYLPTIVLGHPVTSLELQGHHRALVENDREGCMYESTSYSNPSRYIKGKNCLGYSVRKVSSSEDDVVALTIPSSLVEEFIRLATNNDGYHLESAPQDIRYGIHGESMVVAKLNIFFRGTIAPKDGDAFVSQRFYALDDVELKNNNDPEINGPIKVRLANPFAYSEMVLITNNSIDQRLVLRFTHSSDASTGQWESPAQIYQYNPVVGQ